MITIIRRIISYSGSVFLTGLLTVLPIILTISLFATSFKMIRHWLHPLYRLEPAWLQAIPCSEFMLAFAVIMLVGIILHFFLLHSFILFVESIINAIPLVRPVYTGIKQLVQAFNPQDKDTFKHVVLIEFPRKGIYSLGFVTSELPTALAPDNTQRYYNIFVPTTPMPTNGYYLIMAAQEVRIINITRQEAMALIISGGIIQPSSLEMK